MKNNKTRTDYFETTRESLLASLYTHDYQKFERTFSNLLKTIKLNPTLSENAQKSLYQISSIADKFKKKDACADLSQFLKNQTRLETKNPGIIDYDTWRTNLGIDEQTLKILFSTTINLQLSTGCSNYCKRCNEWALPGVRKHFSYNAVIEITKNLAKESNKEYALYSASDPLDWVGDQQGQNRDITHLMEILLKEDLTPDYGLLTKIPRGKELVFKQLIQKKTNISASITSLNRERIKKIENQLSQKLDKQHDTDDLLIPAGRDEDFSSIKSSITDSYGTEITPDGAFIVAPTFTSALNPTGQKRIPVDKNTNFFIQKMVGTKGLKFDYFQHLPVIDTKNKQFTLKYLLDSQIENLLLDNGDYDVTQPGMISLKEYFETFKSKAVNKRKNMLASVKKRLNADYSDEEYNIKLQEYKDFCDQSHVNRLKQKIIIYFLASIKKYLKDNSDKKEIIWHLREKEIKLNTKLTNRAQIEKILQQNDSDTFQLFNQLIFTLLNNPTNPFIKDLIDSHTIQ